MYKREPLLHAAPDDHLLEKCLFAPDNGLPEPVRVLFVPYSGAGRMPDDAGRD
jgi:hypothetical protein